MIGQRLHEYDLRLCDYAVAHVADYFGGGKKGAVFQQHLSEPMLRYCTGQFDPVNDSEQLLLTADEMRELIDAVDATMNFSSKWLSYDSLHRDYVATVREVGEELTKRTANDWADDCAGFASRLEMQQLSLTDGIEVIIEWVSRLRRLLRAMGASNFLPFPEGSFRTPTACIDHSAATVRYAGLSRRQMANIDRMRRAIVSARAKHMDDKPANLINLAGISNSDGREALRWLESHEGYKGFARRRQDT
jgi:hypothetical protein